MTKAISRSRAVERAAAPIPVPAEGWYETLYGMLLGSLPYSLLLIDRGLRVESANLNFYEKSHRREADTVGALLGDVFPRAILDFTNLEAKVRAVFETGKPLPGAQMTYKAPGIQTRVYYYSVVPVKSAGAVRRAMLLMDDITEKAQLSEQARAAERHLASIAETASDLVVSTDAAGRIVSWNAAAERISGYPAAEIKGQLLTDLCAVPHRHDVATVIHSLVAGKVLKAREFNLLERSGRLVPIDWSWAAIRDDGRSVTGVVAIGRDLTERRAFEKHLYESEKLSALGVMAGGIAHEVRNPLSVSFSAAQFLRAENLTPKFSRECVEMVITGIDRASRIIENLLRFARPSSTDALEPIDLTTLLRDTTGVVAPQAKLQQVRITVTPPPQAVMTTGNPNLLQQVFMNLILNAIQAMPRGGDVTISVAREGPRAVLRFVDNGCGIPAQNLGKLFDPFFTTQPVGKGTGLGLSICHTIVKQHGGVIAVQSVEGAGTTFTLSLPVHAGEP